MARAQNAADVVDSGKSRNRFAHWWCRTGVLKVGILYPVTLQFVVSLLHVKRLSIEAGVSEESEMA